MYFLNLIETVTWIWALILFSDKIDKTKWGAWFQNKPETNSEYFLFTMQFGYMCGLNAIGGHELMHRREWYNKIGGTWPYTKFFYSHFLSEHIEGSELHETSCLRRHSPIFRRGRKQSIFK